MSKKARSTSGPDTPPTKIPLQIKDFLVLPLALPPLPAFPTPATHFLYVRPHTPKEPTPDSARSLFAVNVPFDATEAHIRALFANTTALGLGAGKVERVEFDALRTVGVTASPVVPGLVDVNVKRGKKRKRVAGDDAQSRGDSDGQDTNLAKLPDVWDRPLHGPGSSAVIVFVDRPAADAALKAIRRARKDRKTIEWSDAALLSSTTTPPPPLGSARYAAHHALTYPPRAALLAHVANFMTSYSALEARRARAQAAARNVPDADGFVTVTRGGRAGPARADEAAEKAREQAAKEEARRPKDFYRFQVREERKARAGELVKRFEEDRARVERMRKERGGKGIRPE